MPITSVSTPNGQVVDVDHPEGATDEQIISFAYRDYVTNQDEDGLLVDVGKTILTGAAQTAINSGAGYEQIRGMLLSEDEDDRDEVINEFVAQQPPELGITADEVKQHRQKKKSAKDKALDNALRLRNLANNMGQRIGQDQDFAQSFAGQVVQGFAQVPQSLAAGAAGGAAGAAIGTAVAGPAGTVVGGTIGTIGGVLLSAFPQMVSESINDAERTLKKPYPEMNPEERDQVALSTLGYATLGTALESAGFLKAVPGLRRFVLGRGTLSAGVLKSLRREVAEGFAAEGFTEATQGQLLDAFAAATYDDDREQMSMEVLGQRFNEFLIGGIVGGGTAGGIGAFERAANGTLFQPRTKEVTPEVVGEKRKFLAQFTDKETGTAIRTTLLADTLEEANQLAFESYIDTGIALPDSLVVQEEDKAKGADVEEEEDVAAEAAAVGLTPQEFNRRLEGTKVVNDQGKPLRAYRGTRNIEFETEGRGRLPSFTNLSDVASAYSSTIKGGPFTADLSFQEGASVSPVFLSMKKPLDFTEENNLMSLGNYLAYMKYGDDKNGITKEEVDKLINYMVNRGRRRTKAKDAFVFRLDDSFVDPRLDFSRDEYSDLVDFKNEYDSGFSLEDPAIQDGLYFDQFIAADAPVTKRVAERLGFDGIIHKDAFGLKEEYEKSTGRKIEGLTQEQRIDELGIVTDDVHITYRPFSEDQIISGISGQQQDVVAGVGSVEFIRGATGDPKQNLKAKKNRRKGTGEGKNESLRLEVDGLPLHIGNDRSVGGKSFAGWAEETSAWFTDDEIFTAGSWYDGLEDRFIQEFGPDRGPKMMLAWLASQQNASPSAGIQNTFRVIDRLVGIKHGKKGGLADAKLESIFRDQVPEKGLGAKLSDFIDAGNGRTTRTIMGDSLEGGRPFVADVHTGRDSGKLDQQTLTRLKEFSDAGRLTVDGQPATVVITKTKKKQDKIVPEEAVLRYGDQEVTLLRDLEGSPSGTEYEAIAEWGNDLTDYLNEISWKGKSDWLPAQIQAVGWMRTLRQYGLKESDLETSFIENTYRVSAEVDYGLGGAITSIYPKFDELNEDQKTQVTEEVLNDIVPAVIQSMAPSITLRDSQFGVGSWEGNLAPSGQFYLMGSEEAVRVFTNTLAWVTEQAGTASVVMGKGGKNKRALTLRGLSDADVSDFVDFVKSKQESENKAEAKAANLIQGFSTRPALDGDGIILFGLTEAKVNKIRPLLDEFASTRNDLIVDDDSATATFTTNDWKDKKNGESYLQEIQSGGVTTQVRDRLIRLREQYGQKLAEVGQRVAPEVFGEIPVETRVDRFVDAAKEYLGESEVTVEADVSAEAITARSASSPEGGFNSINEMGQSIRDNFKPIASKVGVEIQENYSVRELQYNVSQGVIEYNPRVLFESRSQEGIQAAMREEVIHAAMHKVLMQRSPSKSRNDAWLDFMGGLGKDLTQEQRDAISGVYTNLQSDSDFGAEYSRAAIQYLLYGGVTEQYVVGGKAWSKIQKLFKAVQTYLARTLGKDIETNTEAAAVIRDSVDLVLKSDPTARITNQTIAQQARKKADGTVDTDVIVNADKAPSKKKAVNAFDKYFFTASSVLSKIHPEFTRLFQQYFDRMGDSVLKSLKTVRPFIQKFNGIQNQKDKRRLKQLLYYSPSVTERTDIMQQQGIDPEALLRERDQLLAKYNMLNDYSLYIVPVLARIRSNAQAQGIEVGELSDYFPRRVKDLDGLRESLGQPVAEDFRSYIDRINFERGREQDTSKKKPLIERGSTEEALEFEKYLRSGGYTQSGITPRNLNQRTYEFIRDEDIDFYADPGEAIESYIQAMVTATETKRFIGKRYEVDGSDIILFPKEERPGELGLLIQDLLQRGEIDETQAFQSLPDFTKMILNPMMKENPALGALRTFSYFTLLVEPTSTISQIFDLPFQMFENGFFRTVGSMVGGKTFRLEDVGISNEDISAEFRNETKVLNDALRIGLRATGFARLDQLMKETNLNANYRRIRSQARRYLKNRNTGQSKRLKTELDFLLGNDADAAIAAFADGDRNNPLVREVLLRKLLETQPVNILEMPLAVAQNPNLRMLYTMKSFMIKQLTFVKDRMLVEMFGADKTPAQRLRGAADLSKLMFFMMLVGMPADALKDFLAGRSGYLSDYIFNGIGRVFGISRYQAYVARKEGIGQAVFDFVTPVAIQQGVDNTAELQRVLSGEKAITDSKLVTLAPLSDVLNRIFGFSQEREFKEFKRRQREGEAPLFIPPGAF